MIAIALADQNELIAFTRENNVQQLDLLITKLRDESHIPKAVLMASTRDEEDKTLIHIAIDHNAQDVLGYCLFQTRFLEEEPTILHQLINNADVRGMTALHAAAANGDYYAVHDLLKRGANLHLADHSGRNILHHALCGRSFVLIEELLCGDVFGDLFKPRSSGEDGEGVSMDVDSGSGSGSTATASKSCKVVETLLLAAAAEGHRDVVAYLLDHCADHEDEEEINYAFARELALSNGHDDVVQVFDRAQEGAF
ncbi:hypothetical protein MGN70_012688 [Eutypa lata]|nr:hypothetical protein MGN70_012688 [Eutypa lata]